MALDQALLGKIVLALLNNLAKQDSVKRAVLQRLGRAPERRALQQALRVALEQLERDHPAWTAALFDANFMEVEAAPILARLLSRSGRPDPSELARSWAASLNVGQPDQRSALVRELEPVAAGFLESFASALRDAPKLRELADGQALDTLAEDIRLIRDSLGAQQATPGTRWDYLRWLIGRTTYMDVRGILQTHRQVQVKLDEVHVSLQAHPEFSHAIRQGPPTTTTTASLGTPEVDGVVRGETTPITLNQAVRDHRHLVVLGEPGGGKTTLLRYLALRHATALWEDRTDAGEELGLSRFPVLIRIATYVESGAWRYRSLSEYVTDYHRVHECATAGLDDLLIRELDAGRCLVLLDGLDEVTDADERRGIVRRIEDFIRRHDPTGNRFVVTSRKAGYESAMLAPPFVHFMINQMDEKQIECFVDLWCHAVENAQTPDATSEVRRATAQREIDGIMHAVRTSPGVRGLAANPLMLCTLALIHRTGARLPQKRIELYKLAADVLARTWRTAQGVPESALVREEFLTPLLSRLAYWMHLHKPTGIAAEAEVIEVLGAEWARIRGEAWDPDDPGPAIIGAVQDFLERVRVQTGLFVERAPRQYGFMHLTFEEYYAARFLVTRHSRRAKLIRQHLHDPRWEEPILLAIAFVGLDSVDDATELVMVAILARGVEGEPAPFPPSPYEELLGRDFRFALRCLGDQIPIAGSLARELTARLVNEVVNRPGSARFIEYWRELADCAISLHGADAWSYLVDLLADRLTSANIETRQDVVRVISSLQFERSKPGPKELLQILMSACRDPVPPVREKALRSLWQWRDDPAIVDVLIDNTMHADSMVRTAATHALRSGSQVSWERRVKVLANMAHDPDSNVAREAINSLWDLNVGFDKEVAKPFILFWEALQDLVVESVHREEPTYHAHRLDIRSADGIRVEEISVPGTGTKICSIGPVGRLSDIAYRDLPKEPSEREAVLFDAIEAALQDADAPIRTLAAHWLAASYPRSQGSQERTARLLTLALSDPNPMVHDETMRGIRRGHPPVPVLLEPSAVERLILWLQDPSPETRLAAAAACGELATVGGMEGELNRCILSLLEDDDNRVCRAASQSTASRIDQRWMDTVPIMDLISNSDEPAQLAAVTVVCKLGSLDAVPERLIELTLQVLNRGSTEGAAPCIEPPLLLNDVVYFARQLILHDRQRPAGFTLLSRFLRSGQSAPVPLGGADYLREDALRALLDGLFNEGGDDETYFLRSRCEDLFLLLAKQMSEERQTAATKALADRLIATLQQPYVDLDDYSPKGVVGYRVLWQLVVKGAS
jgi:hypothetical protein